MTVEPNSIDVAQLMSEHLERAEPDLLRELLRLFVPRLDGLREGDPDARQCRPSHVPTFCTWPRSPPAPVRRPFVLPLTEHARQAGRWWR